MKITSKVLITLFALAATVAAPLARAQEAETPKAERMGPPGGGPRGERGDRAKMLAERLDLTADQKTKVAAILKDEVAAMDVLRDDKSVTREARRDKMREIRDAHAAQIRAVLTPEQATKLDTMEKNMRDRGPGGPGGPRRGKDDDAP